jgi:23S rRNA pseudouridine1911/1915/1917 synthase
VTSVRTLPVPEGLDGMRVDAGLAKLLGLSRTVATGIVEDGSVLLDGAVARKSDRLAAGARLEVTLPEPDRPAAPVAEPVPGLRVLHDDEDIVVVDKPVGVAAHPSPGWAGATVVGGLAAAGIRVATSGAAERQGIVHRLDAGTSGVMLVAKSERAYSLLKQAFRQALPGAGAGPSRPAPRHDRRAHRPPPSIRLALRGGGRRQARGDALRGDRGLPVGVAV